MSNITAHTNIYAIAQLQAWVNRFPCLVQEGSDGDAAQIDFSLYSCHKLHSDQLILPLDNFRCGTFPIWLNDKLPNYFYSALVLLTDTDVILFEKDFEGFADFAAYLKGLSIARERGGSIRWGIKVLKSKFPLPIAASREVFFNIAHADLPLPLFVGMPITNACNLCCTICGTQNRRKKELDTNNKFIDKETFEKIARATFPYCHEVEFNSLGESTLHPDFGHFIDVVNEYDCYFKLQTNGTIMTDAIVKSLQKTKGLISFSIDATERIFEEQRASAKWEKVDANVRQLLAVRDRSKLTCICYPTLTRRTAKDVINLCQWADSVGMDALWFHYYDPNIYSIEEVPTPDEKFEIERQLQHYINTHNTAMQVSLQSENINRKGLRAKFSLYYLRTKIPRLKKKIGKMLLFQKADDANQSSKSASRRFMNYDPNLPKLLDTQTNAHPEYVCVAPLNNLYLMLDGQFTVCCRTSRKLLGTALSDEDFLSAWCSEELMSLRNDFRRDNLKLNRIETCKKCVENAPKS